MCQCRKNKHKQIVDREGGLKIRGVLVPVIADSTRDDTGVPVLVTDQEGSRRLKDDTLGPRLPK